MYKIFWFLCGMLLAVSGLSYAAEVDCSSWSDAESVLDSSPIGGNSVFTYDDEKWFLFGRNTSNNQNVPPFYKPATTFVSTSSGYLFVYRDCNDEVNLTGCDMFEFHPTGDTCLAQPTEPAECQNGVKDNGEQGIDCGGECDDDTCTAFCPDTYTNILDTLCASPEVPMINGSCPIDYPNSNATDQVCNDTVPITWAHPDYDPDAPPTLENFITYESEVTVDSTTSYNTVDNGNGTSTRTETETKTESLTGEYDKTTTTTTTVIFDNSTGDTISKTVNVVSTQDQVVDGSEGIYSGDPDGLGDVPRTSGSDDGSALDWTPLKTATDTMMTKFPFSTVNRVDGMLDTWIVTPMAPQIDLPMTMIRPEPFVMDLTLLDPLAVFFRACLAFTAWILGCYVIIRTWRG